MELNKLHLILGSQSPRRKELLSWLNIPYKIITADLEEVSQETNPSKIALDIALQKAIAVQLKCSSENNLIISADTIVVLENKIYGKPKDREDAKRILSELSDRTHQVITGVCFLLHDKKHVFYDQTDVTFKKIDQVLMNDYLDTKDSLDKAGAYGIQGPSLTFISRLNGSYSNVVGFPLDRVVEELEKFLGADWRNRF